MDTLEIINKLKKKRPDLAKDPLFAELEMAQMGEEELPSEGEEGLGYLDAVGSPQGDAGADALMAELDAEEGMESEADAFAMDEAEGTSYLDEEEGFEDELEDEEEPAPVRRRRR